MSGQELELVRAIALTAIASSLLTSGLVLMAVVLGASLGMRDPQGEEARRAHRNR